MNHGAKTSELADEPQEDGAFLDSVDPPADLPDPDLGENSLKVLERRYLIRGDDGELAETPRQMFWRVARTVASAEVKFDAEPEEAVEVARGWAARARDWAALDRLATDALAALDEATRLRQR